MQNIDLNVGGVIGALVGGGIAAAIVFATIGFENSGRGPKTLVGFALFGGAVAGNFLWGTIFKKPK